MERQAHCQHAGERNPVAAPVSPLVVSILLSLLCISHLHTSLWTDMFSSWMPTGMKMTGVPPVYNLSVLICPRLQPPLHPIYHLHTDNAAHTYGQAIASWRVKMPKLAFPPTAKAAVASVRWDTHCNHWGYQSHSTGLKTEKNERESGIKARGREVKATHLADSNTQKQMGKRHLKGTRALLPNQCEIMKRMHRKMIETDTYRDACNHKLTGTSTVVENGSKFLPWWKTARSHTQITMCLRTVSITAVLTAILYWQDMFTLTWVASYSKTHGKLFRYI